MPILGERETTKVRETLRDLAHSVTLVNFTQEVECETCKDTRGLLEELAATSDKLTVEVHDLVADKAKADELGVDKIPATVLIGERGDRGVRFLGIPAGYEFAALLEDIRMVAGGDSGLTQASRDKLAGLTSPLHLQVFVTPT